MSRPIISLAHLGRAGGAHLFNGDNACGLAEPARKLTHCARCRNDLKAPGLNLYELDPITRLDVESAAKVDGDRDLPPSWLMWR